MGWRESFGVEVVMEDLETVTVLDASGQSVELGSMWAHQPVVLVFVRHFG